MGSVQEVGFNGRNEDVMAQMKISEGAAISPAPRMIPRKTERTDGKYSHLLSPLKLNDKYTMRCRITTAPMAFTTTVVGNDFGNAEYAPGKYKKIENPAKGGCGMVCTGGLDVNGRDAASLPLPLINTDKWAGEAFEQVSKEAWVIKRHGAIALLELAHAGAMKPNFPGSAIWGPSSWVNPDGGVVQEMNKDMMQSVINDFVRCAIYGKMAGFDGVCLHAGHGFLLNEFMSSNTNHRTDEYGGSLENRARFPLEVFKAIREATDPDFIIEVRVSGREGIPGGMEVEEVAEMLKLFEDTITCVHISSGAYNGLGVESACAHVIFNEHGYNRDLAAYAKSKLHIPVGVVGFINDPDDAESILAEGKADYIVMGRQMIADPEFANKVREGREDEIRKCLGCMHCMEFPDPEQEVPFDGVMPWLKVSHCEINPETYLKCAPEDLPDPQGSRKVLVIGGGCAGMEAAITAAGRGHDVTLYEASDKLGGILKFGDADTVKMDVGKFKDTMAVQLERSGANICLNTEVTPQMIQDSGADVVIIAAGSSTLTPPIEGIENAIPALDVYKPEGSVGKNVVMVGGGLVGCETGLHLARLGHNVTVFDMGIRVAHESCYIYRAQLLEAMEREGMKTMDHTTCQKIMKDGVSVRHEDGSEEVLSADTVIYALGMKSNPTDALKKAAEESGAKVYVIGDCLKPGQIGNAMTDAYNAAMEIL